MTIKRRLFISNILMLVLPVLLTILTGMLLVSIYINAMGIKDISSFNKLDGFNDAVSDVGKLSLKWAGATNETEIRKDIDAFNKDQDNFRTLHVYEGDKSVFIDLVIQDDYLENMILAQGNNTVIIRENSASYSIKSGAFTLILIDTNYTIADINGDVQGNFFVGILVFTSLIGAVLLTSRLLTTSVFRSITKPLDILINGVHQIRDGNLSYRIEYNGKDEFTGACSDFNEMAVRLAESVNQRQKDDANRKELIAGISHDLRTPLTSIKAYLEGIEKGIAATPKIQAQYFNTIKTKTVELEQIINQLFLFSKIDIGEFPFQLEKVDIIEELSEFATDISEEYSQSGLDVIMLESKENIYAKIDRTQFRNVLFNILNNSLKYKIKKQGKLEISYTSVEKKVVIKLQDDGAGVPNDSLDKLFDVFYRCDPSRSNQNSGSGLGLAIASKVIERLNGTILAQNAINGGLVILITLPQCMEE